MYMFKFKKKVLYFFITHKQNHNTVLKKIDSLTFPSVVVVGNDESYLDGKTLFIEAPDNYDGLPEKVYNALEYLVNLKKFDNYTHFCKLDEDMEIKKPFTQKILYNLKYGGSVQTSEGDRFWGIKKFSKNSKFSNSPYKGEYVPWCRGGYGYVISRKAVNQIKNMTINFYDEPYEDLLIAKLLNKKKIYPKNIINLHTYIYSKNHQ